MLFYLGGRLAISMENLNNFCTLPVNCFPNTCPVTSLDPSIVRFSKHFQDALSKAHPLELQLKKFMKEEEEKKIGWLDDGALGQMVNKVILPLSSTSHLPLISFFLFFFIACLLASSFPHSLTSLNKGRKKDSRCCYKYRK